MIAPGAIGGHERALALDCHQLAELLRCGSSLAPAMRTVAATRGARRAGNRGASMAWERLARAVEGGEALSAAMSVPGSSWHGELAARVRAGEADGRLIDAIDDMQASLLRRAEHRERLRRALVYPAFAAVAMLCALGFVLLQVVPALLQGGLPDLPWHAAPLVWLAGLPARVDAMSPVESIALLSLAVLAATIAAAAVRWRRRLPGPGWRARGGIVSAELEFARLLSTLDRLHAGGIALDAAIELVSRDCRHAAIVADLTTLRQALRRGATLSDAVGDCVSIPPLVQRFVAVGESSGALGEALRRASAQLERQAMHRLDRREALAGPLLMLMTGGMLLWIVVSILLPVYDAALQAVLA